MKVPMSWLRDYVETGLTPEELTYRLTMAGLEAERVEQIGAEWDRVFVGEVRGVERHPNADRLVLADVDAGAHRLTVVTGAPNIAAGQKVALAIAGARLINGHADTIQYRTLKPGVIRGVRSEGMVCSERELGLSDEHERILVLEPDAPVGMPLADWLGDTVIEFEVTPNLVHAFSVAGIAREAGAVTNRPVSLADPPPLSTYGSAKTDLVSIEAPELCSRYIGVVLEGITVGPSPEWLVRRLTAGALSPINNVVDVTNYVMLDLGQPLHAFDRSRLGEGRIVVRRARDHERLETLDHQEREFTAETLVIADAEEAVAVAGVIGGLKSEVGEGTTTILLESANFNMKSIRATARRMNSRTDASARFERGLDPNLAGIAAARATELLLDVIPGSSVVAWHDVYPNPVQERSISLSLSTIERVLGISIPAETVLDVLSRLSFEPKVDDGSTLTVRVPTWRSDVSIAEDIVEEVARIVGYDQLPTTLPTGKTPPIERNPPYQFERRIREALVGAGCVEGRSYVTASREDLVRLGGPDCVGFVHRVHPDSLITLRNPVHSEENVLRPTIIPQLVAATAANLKHERTVRLFEIAPVYLSVERAALPDEPSTLGIVLAGDRVPLSPFSLQHPGEQLDFFDLKGIVQAVLDRAGAGRTCWEATDHPALHSGRAARVTLGDQTVGIVGELLPSVATACGIEHLRVGVAEIDLAGLLAVVERAEPPTVTVPRFLPVQQDFAVVVARETPAADVERALRSGAGPLATDVTLFDLYAGEPLGPGEKSLAYRVTFTAPDRALTDAELGRVRERIQRHLADQVDGALRT